MLVVAILAAVFLAAHALAAHAVDALLGRLDFRLSAGLAAAVTVAAWWEIRPCRREARTIDVVPAVVLEEGDLLFVDAAMVQIPMEQFRVEHREGTVVLLRCTTSRPMGLDRDG